MLANITDQETVRLPPVDKNGITLLEVPDMDKDDNTGAVTVRTELCWYHRFDAKPYSIRTYSFIRVFRAAPAALAAACQRLVRRCLQPRVEKKKAFVLSCRH